MYASAVRSFGIRGKYAGANCVRCGQTVLGVGAPLKLGRQSSDDARAPEIELVTGAISC
jgi:hypothetical protein